MKKLILTVVLILTALACVFLFTACSSATVEGQLEDVWRPYETYVYDVSAPGGVNGTYRVTVEFYSAGSNLDYLGGNELTNVKKGYLISGELNIGGTEYLTTCYFSLVDGSKYLTPVASYRKQTVEENVTMEISGTYDALNYNYKGTVNGDSVSGSIALTSPYYDNNEFHQTLRGANIDTNLSFSFQVPVVGAETAAVKLSASCTSTESVNAPYFGADARECYKVVISRSTKVAGATQSLYYSKEDTTVNGWALKNVLVKIVEPSADGDVVYTLNSVALAK